MTLDQATHIIAIRHGETAWNRETRIQGHWDIPLNAVGLAQAQRVAATLQGESIAAIYSSDLSRARQTAEAIAATTGAPLQLDMELRERAFGVFEGQTWSEITQRWPVEAARWRSRDLDFAADGGGESLPTLFARSVGAVQRLAGRHPGQTVVIVAHGGVLDCLYRASTRLALDAARSWTLGNASINRVLYCVEGFSLIGWNDDFHLNHLTLDEV